MPIMEISVVPVGTGSPSVSAYVAEMVKRLEELGAHYQLGPMGTVVEGSLEELLAIARELHAVPFRMGALRVVTTIKIDDRKDKPLSAEGKIMSVKEKLR
jgi:uncharacterized protein (TIGR00106 family)